MRQLPLGREDGGTACALCPQLPTLAASHHSPELGQSRRSPGFLLARKAPSSCHLLSYLLSRGFPPRPEPWLPLLSRSSLYLCVRQMLGTSTDSPLLTFMAGQAVAREHYVRRVIHFFFPIPLGSKRFHPHFTEGETEAERAGI